MPIVMIPLAINILILVAAWTSQLALAVKVLITAIVVVKFALYFYSVLMRDSEWLRISSCGVILLLNAAIVGLGIVYSIMALVIQPVLLGVLFLIWIILPRAVVSQEKEGSRE